MKRNKKHPDRAPHRRRATAGDRTKNTKSFRITGSWDRRPDRPAVKATADRKAGDRAARDMAEQGAYVIVEEHLGHGLWRTLYEVDGAARFAERERAEAEQRAQAERERRAAAEAEHDRRAREERAEHEFDALARMMCRPPVARDATGRVTARHVTGAR
ncbi:hypothetical protein [Streptomyces mirabilis]|uniref:hypothetical protein n=1 Tax=Streptomyces mirabilis TaxID=68239 RepID=UPI003651B8F5